MSEITMPILKATTEDLCYTHWFQRQLELIRSGEQDTPLYRAFEARNEVLLPLSLFAPFSFEHYTIT